MNDALNFSCYFNDMEPWQRREIMRSKSGVTSGPSAVRWQWWMFARRLSRITNFRTTQRSSIQGRAAEVALPQVAFLVGQWRISALTKALLKLTGYQYYCLNFFATVFLWRHSELRPLFSIVTAKHGGVKHPKRNQKRRPDKPDTQ